MPINKDKYKEITLEGVTLDTVQFNQIPVMVDGDYKENEKIAGKMLELRFDFYLTEAPSSRSPYDYRTKNSLIEIKVRSYLQASNYWDTFFLEKKKLEGMKRANKTTNTKGKMIAIFEPHITTDRYWCDVHIYDIDKMEYNWETKSFRINNQTNQYVDKEVHYFDRDSAIKKFRFSTEYFQLANK